MKEAGYGRIINVTSSAGLRGNFGQTNYGAAKAAIMGMTFIWSLELGRYGITVNAIAPAGATRMTAGAVRAHRHRAAAGGEPGAQRAAGRVPRVGAGRARQRPDPRPHRLRVHDLPAPEADRVDVARRRLDPDGVAENFDQCSASTSSTSAWRCPPAWSTTRSSQRARRRPRPVRPVPAHAPAQPLDSVGSASDPQRDRAAHVGGPHPGAIPDVESSPWLHGRRRRGRRGTSSSAVYGPHSLEYRRACSGCS